MDKVLRKQVFLFYGRLLKRLKRLCWKRSRRVKACVGSNPMSSVVFQEAPKGVFLMAGRRATITLFNARPAEYRSKDSMQAIRWIRFHLFYLRKTLKFF